MKTKLLLTVLLLFNLDVFAQIPSYVPTNGLVGWWPFNGNANDESGNGNHGVVNGATLTNDRNGILNSAYNFDGVNDYIQCLSAGPSGNPVVSTSFWIKTSTANYGHILGYGGNSQSGQDFRIFINGNCPSSMAFDTYDNQNSKSTIFDNNWDFYCIIYDGSIGNNTLIASLYKNGSLMTSDCFNVNISLTNISTLIPITIGRYHGNIPSNPPGFYTGLLDDIAIWNRALTPSEVQTLYSGQSSSCNLGSILQNDTAVCLGTTLTLQVQGNQVAGNSCFTQALKPAGNENFNITSVSSDSSGNIYHSGAYSGNVTIGNTTLNGIGGKDFFLVKYDSCGSQQWAIRGGSTGNEDYAGGDYGKGLATDASGNIYLSGRYNQTCTIYGTGGTSFTAPYTIVGSNANHQDGFLVKISATGAILWGVTLRGGSNDGINAVTVDPSGNPVITAGFNGCCPSSFAGTIFGTTNSLNISSFGSNYGTGVVAKFNSDGAVQWAARIYNRDASCGAVRTDASGNIYVTSTFRSWSNGAAAQVNDGLNNSSSLFNPGIGLGYLLKLAPNGSRLWGTTFGNNGDGVNSLTQGTGIDIDQNGDIWVSGFYSGAAPVFYSVTGGNLSATTSTGNRGFVVKYSPAGQALTVNTLQQTAGNSTQFNAVACNGNEMRAVGNYTGSNLGQNDIVIATYDLSGVQQGVQTFGGSGEDWSYDIRKYKTGYLICGAAGGGANVGGSTLPGNSSYLWNTTAGTTAVTTSYLWSTGATTASINVTPAQTTTYYVTVSNGITSCTDSVTVTVSNLNNQLFNQDTLSVCGTSATLDAGSGYSSYIWNNGATTQSISVSTTSWYKCTISQGSCTTNDSIFVSLIDAAISLDDTTVCLGSSLTLTATPACIANSASGPAWELLIPGSSIPSNGFNVRPFGFDRATQTLYSAYSDGSINRLQKFNLQSKTVTQLPASGWFGRLDEYCYDPQNNRIIAGRSGRDKIYSIPVTGGTWTQIGNGSLDNESYGGMFFWNPVTSRTSYFGGYGFFAVKNWIWENTGNGWINTRPNLSDCLPAKRGGNTLQAANGTQTKLYVFSGQGSCDGNQGASNCTLGSPWQTDVGQYCWLRDLWELDLATYQFSNILPVNNQSIVREGTLAFDYTKNTFYTIGGFVPTGTYGVYGAYTMDVYRMRRNIDSGFNPIQVSGTPPSPGVYAYSIFDEIGNRIIHARPDGIWALNLGGNCDLTYLWSTGATTASINVTPTQNTTYYVTVSNGNNSCMDSVRVTVNNISQNIFTLDTVRACGTTYTLNAGNAGATYNWSTGASTQTINVTSTGWYKCTVTLGGCSGMDSVFVSLLNANIAQNDTTICVGASVTLQAVSNGLANNQPTLIDQFTMTFGGPFSRSVNTEIGAIYSMTISGVFAYHCDFIGQCDAAYAFNQPNLINHQFTKWNGQTIRPNPDVYNPNHIYEYSNLLSTQSTQQFIFTDNPYGDNCGSLNFSIYKLTNPISYLWSTGATTASINVNPTQTTTYYVTISNGSSYCTDSVTITVNPQTSELFAQDTITGCGSSAIIDAGSSYSSYLWNTGATTQSISVNNTGWYSCSATSGSCQRTDSIYVSLLGVSIDLQDTSICFGDSVNLNVTINGSSSPMNGTSELIDQFTMTFGGPYSRTVNTEVGSIYSMTISGVFGYHWSAAGQCDAGFAFNQPNSINHTFTKWNGQNIRPTPDVYNPNHIYHYPNLSSTQSAQNFIFTDNPYSDNNGSLDFAIYKMTGQATYLWSTGATTASINVTPAQTTTYYVTVSNGNGFCTDSVTVTVNPQTSELFAQDTLTGCGSSAIIDAGSGYSSYLWNTGATTQSISVNNTGWYSCILSSGTCLTTDSIYLNLLTAQIINNDTSVCNGTTLTLEAGLLNNSGNQQAYFNDFESCNLNDFTYSGGSIGISNSSFQGSCAVNMTHFAGQQANNFFPFNRNFGYGTYSVMAIATGFISDNIMYLFQGDNLSGGLSIACLPNNTDNPGFYVDGLGISYGTTNINVTQGQWYEMKVEVFPTIVNVYVAGSLRYSTTTFQPPTPGRFKLGVSFSGTYDNMRFIPYGSSPATYLWSTGATTASINVTPAQTTIYYVTVSNGHGSCSDSVKVEVNPGTIAYYADNDSDGYGDSLLGYFCQPPSGAMTLGGDCDGNNPLINPGAIELCNGIDDNCDGQTDGGGGPKLSATHTNVTCFGTNTGSVTISAAGGVPPYTGTSTFTGLAAGTYTYTVTDAAGCSSSLSVKISQPSLLWAAVKTSGAACSGNSGVVSVSAGGGTAPYSGTGTFTGLGPGTYTYTVTDAKGCSTSVTAVITGGKGLQVSAIAPPIACHGGQTPVTVSASGGTPPYSGTGVFPRSAGTYTFQVTDANGCSGSKTITIVNPKALSAFSSATLIKCNGGSSTVTVTASGGTAPYTGTGTFSVKAGTHTYTVTDKNGCTASTAITISQPQALNANIVVDNSSLTLTAVAAGGTAPYSYLWSPGGQTTATISSQPNVQNSVLIVDANKCSISAVGVLKKIKPCDGFLTYRAEDWGADAGTARNYLINNFNSVFPAPGFLTVGCSDQLQLNSWQDVSDFLPSSGSAVTLGQGTIINPGSTYQNDFAAQVIALTLNVRFDLANPQFCQASTPLKDLYVSSGLLKGWTVEQVLQEANHKLGNCTSGASISTLYNTVKAINENYSNGKADMAYLYCSRELAFRTGMNSEDGLNALAYPNPFNRQTTIQFTTPDGVPAGETALIEIYSITGSLIQTLNPVEVSSSGLYEVTWDAATVVEGVYIYRLKCGQQSLTGRIVLKRD